MKTFTVPIWLIGQALAVLLIIVYLYLHKKRKELVSLRNTFINAMAHEMKTPAAVIKNSAECLEDGIHPEKRAEYISMIQKEADHMNKLLMSMLTYTRLSDSSCNLHMEECSLQTMMRSCCDHYIEQIGKKRVLQVIWDIVEEESAICDKKNVIYGKWIISFPMRCGSAYLAESSDCLLPGIMSVYITKEYKFRRNERKKSGRRCIL